MSIIFDKKTQAFYLSTPKTTYSMALTHDGKILQHIYWGKKIRDIKSIESFTSKTNGNPCSADADFGGALFSECTMLECPCTGGTEPNPSAFEAISGGYQMLLSPMVKTWEITKGKPDIKGLPHTYIEDSAEADTLSVVIEDISGIRLTLFYTVYTQIDAITRHAVIENISDSSIKIERAMSATADFEDRDFEFMHLSGAWARERHIQRTPLITGLQLVDSARGASSHAHNPFIALVRSDTTEQSGDSYGMSLVYSGSFSAGVTTNPVTGITRAFIGINPNCFEWTLNPGESFVTPEAVMVYSANGIEGMSQEYHKLYRSRLCRGKYRDAARPVLINNWEGTYFNFDEQKIVNIAKQAKELGIELMVLDDGWFGKRDNDDCSLGDWVEHKTKLPNGIESLASKITNMGLKFGLWFEPEMVSPDSDLHRAHPDWHIHIPKRGASLARTQWILDLTNPDVCDYIINAVEAILKKADISYVKWDMNRNFAELGSAYLPPERMGEFHHRYMLGLYRVMDTIVSDFPDVLFEGCSAGGGRFDPGILYYMPQIWTSDCSEAVERLKIQYGTSIVYPALTMGAHVSAVPNHQTGRVTSLKMRGDVAFLGQFGYELDPERLTDEEKAEIKEQIKFYKTIRETVQFGTMYRLKSPFDGKIAAWNFVSSDGNTVVFCVYHTLCESCARHEWIKLRGLDKNADYIEDGSGNIFGGDLLMNAGVRHELSHDFKSEIHIYRKK